MRACHEELRSLGKLAARVELKQTSTAVKSSFQNYMHFYNFNRLHSTIGYTTPVKFEVTARIGRAA